jgi:hypothetical protein
MAVASHLACLGFDWLSMLTKISGLSLQPLIVKLKMTETKTWDMQDV